MRFAWTTKASKFIRKGDHSHEIIQPLHGTYSIPNIGWFKHPVCDWPYRRQLHWQTQRRQGIHQRDVDARPSLAHRRDWLVDIMTNLANSAFTSRPAIIAYWVATALIVFELAMGGAWDVLRVPQVRGLIEHLGYPPYFLVILGTWKLLGAVALVIPRFPRLKEWAYAGVFFDLTGAVASLFASGLINVGAMAYPILMIGVAVASWALRPPSRRVRSR